MANASSDDSRGMLVRRGFWLGLGAIAAASVATTIVWLATLAMAGASAAVEQQQDAKKRAESQRAAEAERERAAELARRREAQVKRESEVRTLLEKRSRQERDPYVLYDPSATARSDE